MSKLPVCDKCGREVYNLDDYDLFIACYGCGKRICFRCQSLTSEMCIECGKEEEEREYWESEKFND